MQIFLHCETLTSLINATTQSTIYLQCGPGADPGVRTHC